MHVSGRRDWYILILVTAVPGAAAIPQTGICGFIVIIAVIPDVDEWIHLKMRIAVSDVKRGETSFH
jgi:hypothetical protein